ncbi:uncharacterized protein ARMOST_07575 [Armillaria ostoyae]|uniref:DNA 3'-5' helicase n=1 Tax=Armillaria ostoyae TaxID=47428 RepID=A0A284R675_ARMOS|nr:uncharacterized protein ARMOST_07575 [Armillaria ostoyae]
MSLGVCRIPIWSDLSLPYIDFGYDRHVSTHFDVNPHVYHHFPLLILYLNTKLYKMGTVAGPKTIFEALDSIRNAGLTELHDHICHFIDSSRIPLSYISTLTQSQQTICYRFFLLAYFVTGGREAPRAMQLQAALATYEKRDSAVIAGTGSGKTLIIALSILLDNPSSGATITISPLKHLQLTQAADFCNKYKINTIAINDDTSCTQKFWDKMIYNVKAKTSGTAKHFIVTTEQMFKSKEGHVTRFRNLIRTLTFRKTIRHVFVDVAHFIYFAGTSRYKIPAFCPSWGRLNEIKIFLPSIPWQVLTATSPSHVLSVIEAAVLRPSYELVQITSNHPNTTYATHCIVKSLDVMENYDCFLAGPLGHQKKILLFFNNRNLGRCVASYLNSKLPELQRSKGLIKHYDSIMSKEYLEKVHTDFAGENGTCKILCTTSAEAVGIDFVDVDIVGYMDIPQDECDDLQREIDVKEFDNPLMDQNGPDRLRGPLKPTSNKKERAALSVILLLQGHEPVCIHAFKAEYLHDKAPDVLWSILLRLP